MKFIKSKLHTQRRILDKKIVGLSALGTVTKPRSGWLRAIRESLGMSAKALATRLNLNAAGVRQMEEREKKETITLASLDRAARAMDCRLIYAVVPANEYSSLEDILNHRAVRAAASLIKEVGHSMALENQELDPATTKEHLQMLSDELKAKLDPKLWAD